MKIRSKALYQYLAEQNVLRGTPDAIATAKRNYRRLYKKQWKQRRRPRKEIRITVTLKQYADIASIAREQHTSPTALARTAILSNVEGSNYVIHDEQLLHILQVISIAAIAALKQTITMQELSLLLTKAETMLLQYLQI